MDLLSDVRISFKALRINKMRSFLTMLGIVVGVGAVIAMVAIGSGASAQVQAQIDSLGVNMLVIQPEDNDQRSGARTSREDSVRLSRDDATAIAAELPAVAYAAPTVRGNAQIIYGNSNWYSRVEGVTPDYLPIRNFEILTGTAFTLEDDQLARKVALVGKTVIDEVFGGYDPVGEQFRLNSHPFVVVGTLKPKGQSPTGEDQDDTILIPLTTAKRKVLGRNWANAQSVRNIYVQARSAELVPVAEQQIRDLLRFRHNLQLNDEDDFEVRNLESRYEARADAMEALTLMLASIASVSLLVGGIGIMNIMLVSVTERTREIGLRQAVGAKMRDIQVQFLTEAVTLSLVGGTIGILAGALASKLLSSLAGWATLISIPTVIGAFVFSAFVGILFGYYPARRAALLDPIEALRYE